MKIDLERGRLKKKNISEHDYDDIRLGIHFSVKCVMIDTVVIVK
jgi:hypothetical protein